MELISNKSLNTKTLHVCINLIFMSLPTIFLWHGSVLPVRSAWLHSHTTDLVMWSSN